MKCNKIDANKILLCSICGIWSMEVSIIYYRRWGKEEVTGEEREGGRREARRERRRKRRGR